MLTSSWFIRRRRNIPGNADAIWPNILALLPHQFRNTATHLCHAWIIAVFTASCNALTMEVVEESSQPVHSVKEPIILSDP